MALIDIFKFIFSRQFRNKVITPVRRVHTWPQDVPREIYAARMRSPTSTRTYSPPGGLNGRKTAPRVVLSSASI